MLRSRPANPRARSFRPTYPRLVGMGLLVAAAACGGTVTEESSNKGGAGEGGEAGSGGSAGSGSGGATTGGSGGSAGTGGDAGSAGSVGPAGVPVEPYDAGEPDTGPFPGGDIEPPFDAGSDAWEPVDSGEPVDGGEPDAEMGGFAAYVFQGK